MRVFSLPPLTDKAETAVESGSANFQEALIGGRLIPSQSSLMVRKPNNQAVVERGLAAKDLPRPKGNKLATEFPQYRFYVGAIAAARFFVKNGRFNNYIGAHSFPVISLARRTARVIGVLSYSTRPRCKPPSSWCSKSRQNDKKSFSTKYCATSGLCAYSHVVKRRSIPHKHRRSNEQLVPRTE